MNKPEKAGLLALSMAICTITLPAVTHAADGLQSELDRLFNEMSNTTLPGVFETQRRGVVAGGRFTMKTRIFDENLVGYVPPSWKGGCGGVDMFGGSLSFINADQIVQLLRSIAANAKGYLFQLALDNTFPEGAAWIENFQKKVQALNQHLGNSCQLAQGVVNDVFSSFDMKNKTDASITATGKGLYEDFFSSKQESTGSSPHEELKTNIPAEYEKTIGNIVWKQLKNNAVNSWFMYGDNDLLEAIMSLTGTVIIGDLVTDPASSSGAKTNPIQSLPGKPEIFQALIHGGSVDIYTCDSDTTNCLGAGVGASGLRNVSIRGIRAQIDDMLMGTDSTPGLIYKYATNTGSIADPEKAFLANLPVGLGAIIRNLSVLSPDGAHLFAAESSGAIALAMIYNFTEELFRAARLALANSDNAYISEALQRLDESQRQVATRYSILASQYGDLSRQIDKYNNMLETLRKQKYMLATLTNPPSTN